MAITLTKEHLPQSVFTGEATPDLAKPLTDFMDGVVATSNAASSIGQGIGSALRGAWIRIQSWWQYGNKNPIAVTAAWIDNRVRLSAIAIGGVNLSKWASEDPIGAGTALSAVLLTGIVLKSGQVLVGAALSAAHAGLTAAGKIGSLGSFLPGVGGLVRWFVSGIQRIWGFNWNQTDAQIRQQQTDRIKGLASRWGETMGAAIGTLCGFTLGRAAKENAPRLVQFDPLVVARVQELDFRNWDDTGELWEEAVEELKSALVATGSAFASVVFMETYVNIRKLVKASVKYSGLGRIFPWLGQVVEQWGAPGSKPWTFSQRQEDFIESIQIDWLKSFTEEFVEASQDMCAESTILVSYAI